MLYSDQVMLLDSLLQGVNAASGPDRRLDYELFRAFAEKEAANHWDPKAGHFYTASVDQALGLVSRLLPQHGYRIQRGAPGMKPVATLFAPIELPDAPIDDGRSWARPTDGTGATDALALISALLSAKLALLSQDAGDA